MRILASSWPGAGHLTPVLAYARAFARAGDEVLVAVKPAGTELVRAAGFEAWALPAVDSPERDAVFARARSLPPDEANALVGRDVAGRIDARAALPSVQAAIAAWRPDLVVHDTAEFAASLAAERAGLPTVAIDVTLTDVWRFADAVAEGVAVVRRDAGLAPKATNFGLPSAPRFTFAPPLFEAATDVVRFREPAPPAGPLPDWWPGDERPLVLLTLGSVAGGNGFFPGTYRAAIDALVDVEARVLVTVGREADPAELGPLPAGVRVEPWVPLADALAEASVVACHGGSGTVLGALAAGRPLAVLPLFADQPYNARRVHELGAGLAVDDPAALGGAVRRLLSENAFGGVARRIAADIRGLEPIDAAPGYARALVGGRAAA